MNGGEGVVEGRESGGGEREWWRGEGVVGRVVALGLRCHSRVVVLGPHCHSRVVVLDPCRHSRVLALGAGCSSPFARGGVEPSSVGVVGAMLSS